MPDYKLPDVGEGLTEAEIVSWKVSVGDVVAINDVVVEIETAKSLVELPSPYAGEVTALLVPEGETVAVGTPIIAIGAPDDAATGSGEPSPVAETPMEIDLSNPAASGGGEGESLVGRTKAERGPIRRPRRVASGTLATHMQTQAAFEPAASPLVEAAEPEDVQPRRDVEPRPDVERRPDVEPRPDVELRPDVEPVETPAGPARVRALAKPPVRKLAKDLGVDLATLAGSGANGVITRDDVQTAAQAPSSAGRPPSGGVGAAPSSSGARERREQVKGVGKMMAASMTRSAFTAPHVTEWLTLDVTPTMEFLDRLRGHREWREVRVGPLLVLARAVMLAMRRTPIINTEFDDAAGEIVHKGYVNLGIAAATPRGLVVPNIKDADRLSLRELADALGGLTATAREGRTQPAEMADGTFTITNVGVFGVDAGTPIINPGESAILCFGAIKQQPWVVDGEIVVRHVTTLALSFDHRHIDGAAGSAFLADVGAILADPATALLY